MSRLPPKLTRTAPLFPYTPLFRSLAGYAFQAGLDDAPFRRIDHHRHARDVGLGGDQLEKGRHRAFGVEQPFVHVDVDDLGAIFDLLARDLDRGGEIVRSEEHTSELQSLMRISYAVFCLKKKNNHSKN